jgi:hypothetical protein
MTGPAAGSKTERSGDTVAAAQIRAKRRAGAAQGALFYAAALVVISIAVTWVTPTNTALKVGEAAVTLAIELFGAALGWVVGVAISPYDPDEGARFAAYAGAASTFVTGYLVAKIDPLVNKLLLPTSLEGSGPVVRALGFATAFLACLLWVHATRSYGAQLPGERTQAGDAKSGRSAVDAT